ncbi:unnamed protein product, partial [marine sediment metagenome]
ATIYIEELKTGSATDIDGRFSLVLKPGKYSAVFNCMGMKEIGYFLEVHSDGQLNISMEKTMIPINEVVIKADRFHNVRGMQMGYESLNMKSIKEIPLVLGEKDLLKVAQMLPGIQTVGEGSSGFNVRGSPADQNMFYINKIPVYNTSHLFGFFSSFSPDIVKDFSLYKSNIPVEYGGRLASFFDISTRQGNKNMFTGRGGVSPVTGHIAIEGPLKKEYSSFVISARSTYSDWLLSKLEDPGLRNSKASFHDISANININPNNNELQTGKDLTVTNAGSLQYFSEIQRNAIRCNTDKKIYAKRERATISISLPERNVPSPDGYCLTVVKTGTLDTNMYGIRFPADKNAGHPEFVNYFPETKELSLSGRIVTDNRKTPVTYARIHLALLGNNPGYFGTLIDKAGR